MGINYSFDPDSEEVNQNKIQKEILREERFINTVKKYKGKPWNLKEEEAHKMLKVYSLSPVLEKYEEKNIGYFLDCWGENWREEWNKLVSVEGKIEDTTENPIDS